MKLPVLLDIFFQVLQERKLTASDLCEKYGFSSRTAYRYIDILAQALPLQIKRGRNGGAYLSDCYKIPSGLLTAEEYEAAIDALTAAYHQTAEERYLTVKRKFSAQEKTDKRHALLVGEIGDIFVCDGEDIQLSQTLNTLQESISERKVLIVRIKKKEKENEYRVEPHSLIFDGKGWLLFAFFQAERTFQTIFIADMVGVFYTESHFRKRPFKRSDVLKKMENKKE